MPEARPSRRRVYRLLAFAPCLALLITVACMHDPWRSGDSSSVHLRDELLGFGVIAGFVALLWVASLDGMQRQGPPRSRHRGFEVLPGSRDRSGN